VPPPSEPLEKLGFLTIGSFDRADPAAGHETTLQVIELGEQLGFDSAWVRHRHLQYGISSPVAVLAAATQRTRRIALGTAVIPLGWENPLRLAEDLATVDVLSGGRLNPGVSVGPPMRYDDVRDALHPDTADVEDFSYERVLRLLRFVAGEQASPFRGTVGIEEYSERIERCQHVGDGLKHGRPLEQYRLAGASLYRPGAAADDDRVGRTRRLDCDQRPTRYSREQKGADQRPTQANFEHHVLASHR